MVYNSLLVDKIMFKGSIIYATKYIEPGGQEAAVENYPISLEVLEVLYNDPNTSVTVSLDEVTENRQKMEVAYAIYAADELKKSLVESGKSEIPSRIQSGESEYRTQKEIEEQKRLEEAILNGY